MAERAAGEEDAREVIRAERQRYPDARHHCSAYVLGSDGALQRSNDDGEPAGTAGAPILEAILGAGYRDVVVVVTRWFGGTLLGSGGLIRAYGGVAADALSMATPLRRQGVTVLTVHAGHDIAGSLAPVLHDMARVIDTEYGTDVMYTVATSDPDGLRTQIANTSSGHANVTAGGTRWMDV